MLGGEAALHPFLQLPTRPNPHRLVAPSLIYLLHAPQPVPGELLLPHKGTFGVLHHLRYRHAAAALSCVAANTSHCTPFLPPVEC